MRSAFFWVKQPVAVNPYRRFGTDRSFPKRRYGFTGTGCVTAQNNAGPTSVVPVQFAFALLRFKTALLRVRLVTCKAVVCARTCGCIFLITTEPPVHSARPGQATRLVLKAGRRFTRTFACRVSRITYHVHYIFLYLITQTTSA